MEKDNTRDNVIANTLSQFNNIAGALYLVVGHLSDSEPVKGKIKDSVFIVLEELVNISDPTGVKVVSKLEYIKSLLRIASIANIISFNNAELLDVEITNIVKKLVSYFSSNKGLVLDIREILENDQKVVSLDSTSSLKYSAAGLKDSSKIAFLGSNKSGFGQNRQGIAGSISRVGTLQRGGQNSISRQGVDNANLPEKRVFTPKRDISKDGFSERQEIIIKEIKAVGQLTIRDLAGKIEGYSEKTIQRELLFLVESGILRKEGERRWSKYSMAVN